MKTQLIRKLLQAATVAAVLLVFSAKAWGAPMTMKPNSSTTTARLLSGSQTKTLNITPASGHVDNSARMVWETNFYQYRNCRQEGVGYVEMTHAVAMENEDYLDEESYCSLDFAVPLPAGATLKKVTIYYRDSRDNLSVDAVVYKKSLSDNDTYALDAFELRDTNTGGVIAKKSLRLDGGEVLDADYVYSIKVTLGEGTTLSNVQIEYVE